MSVPAVCHAIEMVKIKPQNMSLMALKCDVSDQIDSWNITNCGDLAIIWLDSFVSSLKQAAWVTGWLLECAIIQVIALPTHAHNQ